jgi:hypothetical protein
MAIKAASVLRDAGVIALLDVTKYDGEKIKDYAKLAGIDYVVFVDSSLKKPAIVYDVRSDASGNVTIGAFLQQIGG